MSWHVTRIPAFRDNYIWLLHADNHPQAIVVDPGDAAPVLHALQAMNLSLGAIWVTHHHADHCAGVLELKTRFACRVWGPSGESIGGVDIGFDRDTSAYCPVLEQTVDILFVPGHTRGHLAFRIGKRLFCGDLLFGAGCGRLFEGTAKEMLSSLQKLHAMPDDMQIYCAHEYTVSNLTFALHLEPDHVLLQHRMQHVKTRLAQGEASVPLSLHEERLTNPFLRCHETTLAQRAQALDQSVLPTPLAVFTAIRRLKDEFRATL